MIEGGVRELHERDERRLDWGRLLFALVIGLGLGIPAFIMLVCFSAETIDQYAALRFIPGHPRIAGAILSGIALVGGFVIAYIAARRLPPWLARRHLMEERADKEGAATARLKLRFLDFACTRRGVLITTAIIIAFWVPYFVMYFPGITTSFDTIAQLAQFLCPAPTYHGWSHEFIDAEFVDDNPVISTLIYGGFVAAGRALGSDMLGMFMACFVQACITACAYAYVICYFKKLGLPRPVCLAALVFTCLCPILPIAAYSMIKESLFSIFMLLYFMCYLEAYRTKGAALKSWRFLTVFIVFGSMCYLTKTSGPYVMLASAVVLIFACSKGRILSIVAGAVPYVLSAMLVPALLYPVLNVGWYSSKDASIFMGSILYQQVATVYLRDPGALTDEELEAVGAVIDLEALPNRYEPDGLDGTALACKPGMTEEQKQDFLSAWKSIGLRNPADYILSQVRVCGALLVPSSHMVQPQSVSQSGIEAAAYAYSTIGTEFHLDIENPPATFGVAKAFNEFRNNVLSVVPVVSLFLTYGFYGGWIPFIALIGTFYFRKRNVFALVPVLMTAVVLIVCPSQLARYLYPSVYLALPTIGWLLYSALQKGQSARGRHRAKRRSRKAERTSV